MTINIFDMFSTLNNISNMFGQHLEMFSFFNLVTKLELIIVINKTQVNVILPIFSPAY